MVSGGTLSGLASIDMTSEEKHLLLNPGMDRKINSRDHALIVAQDENSINLVKNFEVEKFLVINSITSVEENVFLKECVYQTRGRNFRGKF
jgi:hypothetical protein